MDNNIKTYTVKIYTENQIGLLSQISNIFTHRGISIWTVSAGESAVKGIHTITLVGDASEKNIWNAVRQVEKRVDVVKAFYYLDEDIIYRELALYKIPTENLMESARIEEILTSYGARIVEMNKTYTVIQKTGHSDETAALYDELSKYGILQFVRSGRVAITRSSREPVSAFLAERENAKNKLNNNK